MTVDDRLREAHSAIPEPDAATVARARALLLEAMARDAAGAPARGLATETEAPPSAPRRAGAGSRTTSARLGALRLVLPLAALALAAIAAIAVLPRGGPSAPADAGPVLYQRTTHHVSTLSIARDGELTTDPRRTLFRVTSTLPEELWLAPDGSGRVVLGEVGEARPVSAADERAWRRAGSPDLSELSPRSPAAMVTDYGRGELPSGLLRVARLNTVLRGRDPLSTVPVEPRELRDFLYRSAAKQRPSRSPDRIRDTVGADVVTLLAHPQSTRELRSALIAIVRNLAGVRELGEVADSAGRRVSAFRLPVNMDRGPVIAIDPTTDRLMARGIMTPDGVVWGTAYAITRSYVAEVGDRP